MRMVLMLSESEACNPLRLCVISPRQGIYNLPNCGTDEDDPGDEPTRMCLTIQRAVAAGAYLPFIRTNLVQAQYFKVRIARNSARIIARNIACVQQRPTCTSCRPA